MWQNGGMFLAFFVLLAVGRASEEDVRQDQVPKAVVEKVKARFSDAEVTGWAKETEGDKVLYEATLQLKGRKIDVMLNPEGEIVLIERVIAAGDLPGTVAKALAEKYPKATYKIVEEVLEGEKKKEKLAYYEVLLVTRDKKRLGVQISSEGKILGEEDKGSDPEGR